MLRTLSFKATKQRNTVGICFRFWTNSHCPNDSYRVLDGSLSAECDITAGSSYTVIVSGRSIAHL